MTPEKYKELLLWNLPLLRISCFIGVTAWACILLMLLVLGPGILFALAINFYTAFALWEGLLVVGCWSAVALFLAHVWSQAIAREAGLVRYYGKHEALWVEESSFMGRTIFVPVVAGGWDVALKPIFESIEPSLRVLFPDIVAVTGTTVLSHAWSELILFLDKWTVKAPLIPFVLFMSVVRNPPVLWNPTKKVALWGLLVCKVLLWVIIFSSPEFARLLVSFIVDLVSVIGSGDFQEWLKWRLTHAVVWITVLAFDIQMTGRKYSSKRTGPVMRPPGSFAAALREGLMKFSIVISDMALPHYIRGSQPVSVEGVQNSMDILKDLGWPVNVSLTEPNVEDVDLSKWKEWVLCGTDWHQGIANIKTHTDELLDRLRIGAIEYRRTEDYGSFQNELEATSRYFKSPRFDYPDLDLDDVWFMVKDTYAHSRLTPFNYIIGMWEKKYGLGAFMRRPGSRGKLSRRDFIKRIGGLKPLKEMWRATFEVATSILPVSAVSIKGEALPPRKWLKDKVRTVVGSPLAHYILTTIWNYEPNHRFSWVETPTKIGMPINGYWLADLYHRHSRCQHHYAGDMSDFDSTISGSVMKLVSAVRKKGFENHKDYARICDLIDVGYEQIEKQLLNTTSTGNIYLKGTGETTGHSSTSADNSLAVCILYLMAWKELTGLGAKEFKHFNELSDYGDDHVLSMLSTKPSAWTFKNIQKTMAKWGVTNNLEAEGDLSKIPFLSKFSRKVTQEDRDIFRKLQIPLPKRVVYHDREKLLGKMTAKIKNLDPRYRAKRLISYMYLTSHHEDIYNGIKTVLTRSMTMKRAMKQIKDPMPTYQSVLAGWYNPSSHSVVDVVGDKVEDLESKGYVYSYGQVTLTDSICGMLAMLPDVLNPVIFNFGYERAMQIQGKRWLEWPRRLLLRNNGLVTNGQLAYMMRRSIYACLDATLFEDVELPDEAGGLLLRHWLFILWAKNFKPRFGRFLGGLTLGINKLQFILNARVNPDISEFRFGVLDMVVIALLNFVPEVPLFNFLVSVKLPRLDYLLELMWGFIVNFIWTAVPPNYKEVTHLVRQLHTIEGGVLVTAPTGTGKSTDFIKHLSIITKGFYRKIIVIVPRSILVKSLQPYVKQSLGMDATGFTTGLTPDRNAAVWYMTAQEAVLNQKEVFDSTNLVVLDECHMDEEFYVLVKKMLISTRQPYIMTTATPTPDNLSMCAREVHLTIANLWSVDTHFHTIDKQEPKEYLAEYYKQVRVLISNLWRGSKVLVYVPSIEAGHALGETLPLSVGYLNSKENQQSAQITICTSVGDTGITLPKVDVVITGVLDYAMDGASGKPRLHVLPDHTVKQRRGRTGRTNNGEFHLFNGSPNCPKLTTAVQHDPKVLVPAWLTLGLNVKSLDAVAHEHLKSYFEMLLGQPISPDEYDSVSSEVAGFLSNLDYLRQSRVLASLEDEGEDPKIIFDYTAAGNVSPASLIPMEDITKKATRLALKSWSMSENKDVDMVSLLADLKEATLFTALKAPFYQIMQGLSSDDLEYDDDERFDKGAIEGMRASQRKALGLA